MRVPAAGFVVFFEEAAQADLGKAGEGHPE
jgi:hypothetical protein